MLRLSFVIDARRLVPAMTNDKRNMENETASKSPSDRL